MLIWKRLMPPKVRALLALGTLTALVAVATLLQPLPHVWGQDKETPTRKVEKQAKEKAEEKTEKKSEEPAPVKEVEVKKEGRGEKTEKEPVKEEGAAPRKVEGKTPMKEEGRVPRKTEGKEPMKDEGDAPRKVEGKTPEGRPVPRKGDPENPKDPVPGRGRPVPGKEMKEPTDGNRPGKPIPKEEPKVLPLEKLPKPGLPILPMPGCKHEITFQNLDAASQATKILVSPFGGGTSIASSVAPVGWTATASAAGVEFMQASGAVIPVGTHTGFSITIASNNNGQQYALAEFKTATGQTICGQPLFVPCSLNKPRPGAVVVAPVAPKYTGPACGCLNAYIGTDGTFDIEDAEIDEVTILQIVNAGYLKFDVSYQIVVSDPMPLNKIWTMVSYDETGLETAVPIVPTSDNYNSQTGVGVARFDLMQPGDFEITLVVTSALDCLHNPEAGREMEEEDTGVYQAAEMPSIIEVTPSDPCDYLKYVFSDASESIGDNPQWTVAEVGFAQLPITLDASGGYTFPAGNVTYDVRLVATDHETGVLRPEVSTLVTPTKSQTIEVKFKWEDYNSCPTNNFKVQFKNKTKGVECPITWKWDFGDNSPISTDESPLHNYVNPGLYKVTLEADGNTVSHEINIAHWEPKIDPPVDCGDGTILWSTSDGSIVSTDPLTINFPRKWTVTGNGGGSYNPIRRRFKTLRVCYSYPGIKEMTLWARNKDGGKCQTVKRLEITTIDRCCRRDKISATSDPVTVGGKQYRIKAKALFRGWPGRIRATTKLQVLKNNIWRRKKADSISSSISGVVFTKDSGKICLCATLHTIPLTTKSDVNRARVSKLLLPGLGTLRVKEGSVKTFHKASIGGHQFEWTLSLWDTDCKCGWTP